MYDGEGPEPDQIEYEDVPAICREMQKGWRTFAEKVEKRRRHFHNDDSVDPQLGKVVGGRPDPNAPFAQVSRYQTDKLRQTAVEWVSRIAENPMHIAIATDDVDAADASVDDVGADIARIWNAAGRDIELRSTPAMKRQDVAAWRQAIDPYAIYHTCRRSHLWPSLKRMETEALPATPKERDRYESEPRDLEDAEDCPTCDGKGELRSFSQVSAGDPAPPCPDCNGGKKITVTKRRYVEKGDHYESRLYRKWADGGGCGWHDEFIDFMQFVPEWGGQGDGLRRALVHFEVALDTYTDAQRDGMSVEQLRSEQKAPGDQHGEVPHETPTSADKTQRVTVYQLWTRTHYYEWADGVGDADASVKGWEHGYDGVPFWLIPCHDTGDLDPMRRFECALEGMFRVKEYVDRAMTITAAAVEAQANPLTTRTNASTANGQGPPILTMGPDGNPVDVGGTEQGRQEAFTGELKSLTFPMPASVPQWLEFIDTKMSEAAPETGRAEIEPTTQAWTARQAQSQANIGPKRAIEYQRIAFEQCVQFRQRWHQRHNVPLVNYPRNNEGHRVTKKPLVVEAAQLEGYDPIVRINTTSEAETITEVEFLVSMFERGFAKEEDIYEAQGYEDPQARALEVKVARVMGPLKEQRILQAIGERMGSRFVLGPMGEPIGPGGASARPEDIAMQNGIQPGQQQLQRIMAEMQAQIGAQGANGAKSGGQGASPIAATAGSQTQLRQPAPLQGQGANAAPLRW